MQKPSSFRGALGHRRLYIFVTSWQPDPYVNVLAYALQHFKLSHVYFISIAEHGYATEDDAEEEQLSLAKIRAGVEALLRELAEGRYTRRGKDGKPNQVVRLDGPDAEFYQKCLAQLERLENTSVVIPWSELDRKLKSFSDDGLGIFDVTAFKKNLLIDTVVILISRGCENVFDFEIIKKGPRTHDERELIHSLKEHDEVTEGDYIYRNLAVNEHLVRAEKRLVAHSLRVRSLIFVTAAVGLTVLVVQIFFPRSWPEIAIGVIATTAAISAFVATIFGK